MGRIRRYLTFWMVLLVTASLIITGCDQGSDQAGTSSKNETLKIGLIVPWTGALGSMGLPAKNGALVAEKVINDAGGVEIKGKKYDIKLIPYDDGSVPDKAVSATQKLINEDGVKVIFGALGSASTLALSPVTESTQTLLVTVSTAAELIGPDKKLTIRPNFLNDQVIKAIVPYYKNELGLKKVAMIVRNDAWGISAEETFIKEFKKNGVEVIAKEVIETTSTDFNTPLTKLRSSNPDALVLAAYPDQAGLIKKQQVEIGWDIPTLAQGQPVAGQAFTQLGGPAVEGHLDYDTLGNHRKDDPKVKEFAAKFEEMFKSPPTGQAFRYFDIVNMIIESMKNADSTTDPLKIRNAFTELEYKGLDMLTYRFEKSGQLLPQGVIVKMNADGSSTPLTMVELDKDGEPTFTDWKDVAK
ncbi:ABC transporter substrate-binding protein [Neobacillus niacini]|uniref:ABC transporter substrate-binding protein n=1 Tax=Neobacillus niacini TaxID=86668 RepID=UPI002FFE2588